METKFKVGDVLNRTDEPLSIKYVILEIFVEKTPFYKQVWYRGIEGRNISNGKPFNCLQSIMEESFEKLFSVNKELCENLAKVFLPEVC